MYAYNLFITFYADLLHNKIIPCHSTMIHSFQIELFKSSGEIVFILHINKNNTMSFFSKYHAALETIKTHTHNTV